MDLERYTHLLAIRKAEPHYCQVREIGKGNARQKEAYISMILMRGWEVHLLSPDFDVATYMFDCAEQGISDDEKVKHILEYAEISMSVEIEQ